MASTRTGEEDLVIQKMTAMFKEVRGDIAKSEENTVKQIDKKIEGLSSKLALRLDRAEGDLSRLGSQVADARADIAKIKEKSNTSAADVQERISAIERRLNAPPSATHRPIPPLTGANATPLTRPASVRQEESYWKARRSLRLWPCRGPDYDKSVREFLGIMMKMTSERIAALSFTVVPLPKLRETQPDDQVVAVFETAAQRDEVKFLSKNLAGQERSAGAQLEPPDHLRGHYQAFQSLAWQMKRRSPHLKRNVKFQDEDQSLIMDVKTSSEAPWKTIFYADAKAVLGRTRHRSNSLSREQLAALVRVEDSGSDVEMSGDDNFSSCDDDDDENNNTVVDITESPKNNTQNDCSMTTLRFINSNARSLSPKINSLHDCFVEKELDFSILTETWFQDGRLLAEKVEEYADNFSLGTILRNRTGVANNGRQYGGVAFLYRKATCQFDVFPLSNPECHEVLAVAGRVHGIKEKVCCLVCYAPPNLTPTRSTELLEYVSDVVSELKRKFRDSLIIVGGDFNQWPVEDILEDHPDLTESKHGPTRGDLSIDRTFTNFGRSISEALTLEPLETEDGRVSDHKIAFTRADFPKPKSGKITYSFRAYTERGAENFCQSLTTQSWQEVYSAPSSTAKVIVFQRILMALLEACFEWKTTTRLETDPPWMNNKIKRLIKKRRKVYDREGRSTRWKSLKKQSDKLYTARAAEYMERQRSNLTSPDASRNFFRNVRSYRSRENPPQFNVSDLYPELDDAAASEKLAEHFNAISNEFAGLDPSQIPTTSSIALPALSIAEVMGRLKSFKKPKSMVAGDIFPCLINRTAHVLACPLSHIYNCITESGEWPSPWKIEYVTPIPKKTIPQGPNDLRNISCTQLFSKVYESWVLEWAGLQVKLRTNQFGGVKGSGAEHYLVELWQKVLENLEDPRAASLITSIDYSKAFNRMDFPHCLRSLANKGLCNELLRIIASFLSNREMRVKVGAALSAPRPVLGGVPQGSILGVFLFNCAIDMFEAHSTDVEPYGPVPEPSPNPPPPVQIIEVPAEPTERDYRHLPLWQRALIQVLKYVDDNILHEKLNFDTVPTDGYGFRVKLAARTQNLFREIVRWATSCGMKVNTDKTFCLLISEIKSYNPAAYFFDSEGNKVSSGQTMTILGFDFSSDPDMGAQVRRIKRGFTSRIWILRHLGHVGFSQVDLLRVYKSVLLPVHDYCSCVFNSTLTLTQSNALERLQAQALKAIYGYEYSYRSLLETTGLETLKARRDRRCEKFASKCLANPRYRDWFPLSQEPLRATRHRKQYQEHFARTKRLYNSPIYDMRRRLNG